MQGSGRAALKAGLLLGVLYVIEAILKTGPLVFVWPIFGGLLAAYYLSRERGGIRAGEGAGVAARAALIGGAIMLLIGVPVTYFLVSALAGEEIRRQFERVPFTLPENLFLLLLIGAVSYVLVGLVIATISGAVGAAWFSRTVAPIRRA